MCTLILDNYVQWKELLCRQSAFIFMLYLLFQCADLRHTKNVQQKPPKAANGRLWTAFLQNFDLLDLEQIRWLINLFSLSPQSIALFLLLKYFRLGEWNTLYLLYVITLDWPDLSVLPVSDTNFFLSILSDRNWNNDRVLSNCPCPCVSLSLCLSLNISETVHQFFLIFCMKFRYHKHTEVTDPDFLKKV